MAIRNLLLVAVIVGGLVIFALENTVPVTPLVILGSETVALPLWVWLVGAIAAGMVTTLLIAGLIQVAASSSRPRANRYYADRPPYRPSAASADFNDDDEDWQVIDVDGDRGDRTSSSRGNAAANTTSRDSSSRYTSSRYVPSDAKPVDTRVDTKASSFASSSPRSSSLDDWNTFSLRRTDWENWNTYEDASPSNRNRQTWANPEVERPSGRASGYTSTTRSDPSSKTVIQDGDDRDWQDWSGYQDDWGDRPAPRPPAPEIDLEDDRQPERYGSSPSPSNRYQQSPDEDEMSYEVAYEVAYEDEVDDEDYGDYGDEYNRYDQRDNDDEPDYVESREPSWAQGSWKGERDGGNGGDGKDGGRYAVDAGVGDDDDIPDNDVHGVYDRYDDGDVADAYQDTYPADTYQDTYQETYQDTYPHEGDDGAEGRGDRPDNEPEPSDGFYTDYVRYSDEDDYYDDYDDYVIARQEKPRPQKREPSDSSTRDAELEELEELEDFEDWDDEAEQPPPSAPSSEPVTGDRPIYEVQRQPTAVNRDGTLYSFSYRNAEADQDAGKSPPPSSQPSDAEDSDPNLSTEPRILTTPPPNDPTSDSTEDGR